jgi:formylglycine-generating enzyme required for sulfatase activity
MGTSSEQVEFLKDMTHIEWLKWEQPLHSVYLSEFYIGKYPITNREYQAFIRETNHIPPKYWTNDQYPLNKEAHPVVHISHLDAMAYCEWLSNKTGKPYRLPTEAEWEKAAKGLDERIWPWGNEFNVFANIYEAKIKDTSPVGQFSPQGDSPYGCADMVGNVWEWCLDLFYRDEYLVHRDEVKNPQGPLDGTTNVVRGGSFFYKSGNTRCSRRQGLNPIAESRDIGFRVVVPITDSET